MTELMRNGLPESRRSPNRICDRSVFIGLLNEHRTIAYTNGVSDWTARSNLRSDRRSGNVAISCCARLVFCSSINRNEFEEHMDVPLLIRTRNMCCTPASGCKKWEIVEIVVGDLFMKSCN